MPEIYGFEYEVAQRLKEMAGLPTQVSKARTEPLRRPQMIGGGGDVGRFILTTTPSGGSSGPTGLPMTATADIVQEDSPGTSIADGVTLYLNFDMFGDLEDGDYGQAVRDARGSWIALNAPCTTPGSG